MLPRFKSLPYPSNQVQTDGSTASSAVQQVIPPHHCQGNSTNLFPNSAQIRSQMGIVNPQIPVPFSNSNTHLSNGSVIMSNRSISAPMASPNHLLHLQNGMPLVGQCHSGLMTPVNPIQPPNQLFAPNSVNLLQYLSQNAGFPNGQLCLQSPMQNINQFGQMPMPNYNQVVPCTMPLYPNQVPQALGPQNPSFLANPQFGLVHSNAIMQPCNQEQHNLVRPAMDANAARQSHYTAEQSQGNSPLQPAFGSVPQQTRKDFYPPVFRMSQGNLRKENGIHNLHTNWKNSQNRNFTKNPKRDASHRGFPKKNNMRNAKGNYGFHNKQGEKGFKNDIGRKSELANSTNQTLVQHRRSLSLNYTEQEIQQWREGRRKNYPSKANIEKKLTERMTEPDVTDIYAKLRRQQLKEILAKQAELGCEVAEIPSYYLSDSEKQVLGKEENKSLTKKERFQNKFNKRGRFRQKDRFPKKQKLAEHDSSDIHDQDEQKLANNDMSRKLSLNKRPPTLLQRLLSADIRREKSRLLQVFRFMVTNSFFKDWPEKPLRFPLVIVKETGSSEAELVGGKSLSSGKGVSEFKDNNRNDEFDDAQLKAAYFGCLKGSIGGEAEEPEEEEGEIID